MQILGLGLDGNVVRVFELFRLIFANVSVREMVLRF